MLFLTVARILATFDILPPVDENGHPRFPEVSYTKTLLRWVHSAGGETELMLTDNSPAENQCHSNAW